ncbi:RNA-DNA hybrid ribonuclease [Chytriomyces hyalinus]|nr:RNA-DNA hybrid ribonuclease [Chytriomyces hyalinus]
MPVDQDTIAHTREEERKELRIPVDIDVLVSLVAPFVDAMTVFSLGAAVRSVRPLRQIAFALALANSTTEGRSAKSKARSFALTWLSLCIPVTSPDAGAHPHSPLFDKSHSNAAQIADIVNETLQSSLPLYQALSTESLTAAFLVLQARFRLDTPLTFLNLASFSAHCSALIWRSNVELMLNQEPLYEPSSWSLFISSISADSNFPSNGRRSLNMRKLSLEGCMLRNDLFRILVDVLHPMSSRKQQAIDYGELSTALALTTPSPKEQAIARDADERIKGHRRMGPRDNNFNNNRLLYCPQCKARLYSNQPNGYSRQQNYRPNNNQQLQGSFYPHHQSHPSFPQQFRGEMYNQQHNNYQRSNFQRQQNDNQQPQPRACQNCYFFLGNYPYIRATADVARPSKCHSSQKTKKFNISNLNLNDNLLGDESLELISTRIIPVCHGLICLELKGNQFTEVGIKSLAERLPPCNISQLNLSFTKLSDESLTILCRALPFSSIEFLCLTDNLLTDLGMRALAAHLDSSRVAHLDLSSNNGLRDEGLRLLSMALPNSNVTQLSLADCDIGFQGVYALTKVIRRTRINILKLSRNRRIGDNGVKYFCENAFQARGAKLTELYMHSVNAFDSGCKALSSSLPSQYCLLLVLDLRDNGITDSGAVSFQKHGLAKLQRLLLGENNIMDRGVEALSHALVASPSLVELNLDDNKVGEEGVQALKLAFLKAKRTRTVKIKW